MNVHYMDYTDWQVLMCFKVSIHTEKKHPTKLGKS